jgi:hypothetical protein
MAFIQDWLMLATDRKTRARQRRALILDDKAGAGGAVTAEGGKPSCGVDGSAGVCELLFDLAGANLEFAPRAC